VQRPEANEGGREEEEKCLRISVRKPERLHGSKTVGARWRVLNPTARQGIDAGFIGQALMALSGALKKGSVLGSVDGQEAAMCSLVHK